MNGAHIGAPLPDMLVGPGVLMIYEVFHLFGGRFGTFLAWLLRGLIH